MIRHEGMPLPRAAMDFIAARDTFFIATASADGQPYVQHRGGRPGFLAVLDARTLAFPDFSGNRQYISVGHVGENDRVALILMDYPNRRRLKVWGRATIRPADDPTVAGVVAEADGAPVERVFVLEVTGWDFNCPKYITPRYTLDELRARGGAQSVLREADLAS